MSGHYVITFMPPAEILQDIFSYTARLDLLNAILACKWFSINGRMVLYRYIDLRSDDPHIGQTIRLLFSDQTLSSRITHAILTTRQQPTASQAPWISPDFFRQSVNLRSLEMRGFPFHGSLDRAIFSQTLHVCCKRLDSFTYRPMAVPFPDSGFQIAGLKRVVWHTELDLPLRSGPMLTASIDTLTHISFLGGVVHSHGNLYHEFLALRFPRLQSLSLGSLMRSMPQTDEIVTQFLLAHPFIEHLSLGRQRLGDVFFQLHLPLISTSFLPNLKSFEGFPENLGLMIRHQVRSIFDITFLSLRSTKSDFADMQELCDALDHTQGIPTTFALVKHLRFIFDVTFNHLAVPTTTESLLQRKWMNWIGHICPNALTWCGTLPPMHANHLSTMFKFYSNLEIIALPRESLLYVQSQSSALIEYFLPLVDICPKLVRVVARKSLYSELEDRIYTLIRDSTLGLVLVNVETTRDASAWGIPTSPI